jgi:hypothetical protein
MEELLGKSRLVLLSAMTLALCSCLYADSYSYDFTGEFYLWDISGDYSDDSMGCTIDYTITQDAKGKITGFGGASCSIYGVDIDMTFDIKGSVKQRNGICSVIMNMKFIGTATDGYETLKFKASEKVKAQIDPGAGLIEGTVRVCIAIAGYGSYCDTVAFSVLVPVDMDGSSQLDFDANLAGKKLIGTGTLELSNGDTYDFTVTGKYNAKKNQSTLTLKGTGSAKGCTFKIKVDEGSGDIDSLKAKVLGQCIK